MRTSAKLLIALVVMLASLAWIKSSLWLGLTFGLGLVGTGLWGMDYAAELRKLIAPAFPQRVAHALLADGRAGNGLLLVVLGLWMLVMLLLGKFGDVPTTSMRGLLSALMALACVVFGLKSLREVVRWPPLFRERAPGVLRFRSDLFRAIPRGDEASPPGRALADWLEARLRGGPLAAQEVNPIDDGWCLLLQPLPQALAVEVFAAFDEPAPPASDDAGVASEPVTWMVRVCLETDGWHPLPAEHPLHASAEALLRTLREALDATGRVRWVA